MKILVAFSIFLALLNQTLTKVSRINQYLEEAQFAYNHKDFATAIYLYQYLNDSLQVRDREVKVNLGHAYFQRRNKEQALKYYQPLLSRTPPRLASLINLQLGVIVVPEDKTEALEYFKKAIILNPQNEEARYNYELLKKYIIQHPEENEQRLPPPQPEQAKVEKLKPKENPTSGQKRDAQGSNQAEIPDPDKSDPTNPPQPNSNAGNSENNAANTTARQKLRDKLNSNLAQNELTGNLPGDTRGVKNTSDKDNNNGSDNTASPGNAPNGNQTTYNQLKEVGITPEKARMLLEAMREAEIQYLQQIPRKSTKQSPANSPNW